MNTSYKKCHVSLFALLLLLCLPAASTAFEVSKPLEESVFSQGNGLTAQIRQLLAESESCRSVCLAAPGELEAFYAERDFQAAWVDAAGLKPAAQALLTALGDAADEGLDPDDYPLSALERALADLLYQAGSPQGISPALAAALDIDLSRTALAYGRHLARGRISPEKTGQPWFAPRRSAAWAPPLERMVTATTPAAVTAAAAPIQDGYSDLRRALARYHRIAATGGWDPIDSKQTLTEGVVAEAVIRLRYRLEKGGDLHPEINRIAAHSMTLDRFDASVTRAVSAFQARHGLAPDGKVGRRTLATLNVPVQARIDTLRANMERRRWVPSDLGPRHLRVNIPAFELEAVSAGHVVKTMRVVVGRPKRPTPVLSGRMTYLELNPYWHVPPRIARKDILPKVLADPDYLQRKGFRVFSDWTAQASELDPREIDWTQVSRRRFPYKLRQDPAAFNALGQVKFIFPNEHSIYLHDTPAKDLFEKQRRSFSSGCVRVAEPRELAALLLEDRQAWNRERIGAAFDALEPKVIRLSTPMAVHLQYWTAWVDGADRVHFREDIYQRDRDLLRALERQRLRLVSNPPSEELAVIEAAAAAAKRTAAPALRSS